MLPFDAGHSVGGNIDFFFGPIRRLTDLWNLEHQVRLG